MTRRREKVKSLPTRESQYSFLGEIEYKFGRAQLGIMSNQAYWQDTRRLLFSLARYKFVSKLFRGRGRALEIGCGDGFCAPLVAAEVDSLVLTDFDEIFVADAKRRLKNFKNIVVKKSEATGFNAKSNKFDAVYALDVIEHISPRKQAAFLKSCISAMDRDALLVLGLPSIESQKFASPQSRAGHVNCKSSDQFKRELDRLFGIVMMFHMNDEVVHTGHPGMAHYIFAVCASPKRSLPSHSRG